MIRYNQYENWHERRRKGKSESVILQKGEHEPIISQELWDKVRFIRERKEYVGTKRCHVGYLLTGLLRCPDCDGSMVASRTVNWAKSGEKVVRFYYVCGHARNKGKMACKANSILKEKAELYVHRRLQKVLTNNGILKRVVREMNQRMKVRRIPLERELQGIEQKIEQTEKSKAKYFTLFDKNAIDKEMLARHIEELTTECDQLKHRKYDIEELLQLETTTEQVSADYVKGLLTKLDQLMKNAEFDKKKALLRMVIKRITLENKRIKDIELQFDEKAIQHFFEVDPSAQAVEGSFNAQKSRSKRRFVSITLII
jgi:site-specific DNA recombinase